MSLKRLCSSVKRYRVNMDNMRFFFQKQLISPYTTFYFQLRDQSLRNKYCQFNAEREYILYHVVTLIGMLGCLPFFVSFAFYAHDVFSLCLSLILCIADISLAVAGSVLVYHSHSIMKAKVSIIAGNEDPAEESDASGIDDKLETDVLSEYPPAANKDDVIDFSETESATTVNPTPSITVAK